MAYTITSMSTRIQNAIGDGPATADTGFATRITNVVRDVQHHLIAVFRDWFTVQDLTPPATDGADLHNDFSAIWYQGAMAAAFAEMGDVQRSSAHMGTYDILFKTFASVYGHEA